MSEVAKLLLMIKLKIYCGLVVLPFISVTAFAAVYDHLAKKTVKVSAPNAEQAVETTLLALKDIFLHYRLNLDQDSRIVSPLKVSGPQSKPYMQVTIEKCKFFVCRTTTLRGTATVREVQGRCDRNWQFHLDIARSDQFLSDVYDLLRIDACYMSKQLNAGALQMTGSVRRARRFQKGMIQAEIRQFFRLQIPAIGNAFRKSLPNHIKE